MGGGGLGTGEEEFGADDSHPVLPPFFITSSPNASKVENKLFVFILFGVERMIGGRYT